MFRIQVFFYYHIVVIGLSLIPQLILDPKRESLEYWLTLTSFFILLLVLDDLMIYYTNSSAGTIRIIGYFKIYYKVIPVTIFLFIHAALFYLRSINIQFEEELVKSNGYLSKKIEQLKKTQNQLIESEKMASIGVMSAGLAHEINNPLNFIKGGIHIIASNIQKESRAFNEEFETSFRLINEGVDRASSIIKSLGQFRANTSGMKSDCDINSILNNCVIVLYGIRKKGVEVEEQYDSKIGKIPGNSGALHQAFMNILSNAEQAISQKGEITIVTKLNGETVTISIKDTGIGITQININRIMEPFFTTKSPGNGTGLGLSIAYGIIKEHGGHIDVNSSEGEGTEFLVTLPL